MVTLQTKNYVLDSYFWDIYLQQWNHIEYDGYTPTKHQVPSIKDIILLVRADVIWDAFLNKVSQDIEEGVHLMCGKTKEEYELYALSNAVHIPIDIPAIDWADEIIKMIVDENIFVKSFRDNLLNYPVRRVW
jgi:hypothetical protein